MSMLDSNIILGINRNLNCSKYRHGILSQNWEGWPCGVPIVYPDIDVDKSRSAVRVATLFTPSQSAAGLDRYETFNYLVKPTNIRPLCGNHKVITISEFDPGKFERLTEFVHDVGAISLIVEYKEGRRNIAKGIHAIETMVKYSSLFLHHRIASPDLYDEDDSYVCVMTFIDLPYCVPIFNMRKVDGMGLSLAGCTVKASKTKGFLNRAFRTDILLSNFMDNVFVLDGVSINRAKPIGNEMFSEIEKMTNFEPKIGSKFKKSAKLAKKPRPMAEKYGYTVEQADPSKPPAKWEPSHYSGSPLEAKQAPQFNIPSEVVEAPPSTEPEQFENTEDSVDYDEPVELFDGTITENVEVAQDTEEVEVAQDTEEVEWEGNFAGNQTPGGVKYFTTTHSSWTSNSNSS